MLDHVGSLENAAMMLSRVHRGEKRLVFRDSRGMGRASERAVADDGDADLRLAQLARHRRAPPIRGGVRHRRGLRHRRDEAVFREPPSYAYRVVGLGLWKPRVMPGIALDPTD